MNIAVIAWLISLVPAIGPPIRAEVAPARSRGDLAKLGPSRPKEENSASGQAQRACDGEANGFG